VSRKMMKKTKDLQAEKMKMKKKKKKRLFQER
jgi:hypothetical protein